MATGSSASVISLADPAKAVPSGITTELVPVGIAGLIAGLLTASIVEVVRPRVADAHAFARELGVPMLGTLSARREVHGLRRWLSPRRRGSSPAPTGEGPPLLAGAVEDRTIVALRVAAVRLKAQTLVVIDEADRPYSTVLANGLTARLRALSPAMLGEDGNAPTADSIGVSATIFERSATTALSPVNQGRRTHAAEPSVRVVPMSAITEAPAFGGCALLVLVPKLTHYSYLRRVADLASATGWPVVGVLGTPARAGKGQS